MDEMIFEDDFKRDIVKNIIKEFGSVFAWRIHSDKNLFISAYIEKTGTHEFKRQFNIKTISSNLIAWHFSKINNAELLEIEKRIKEKEKNKD